MARPKKEQLLPQSPEVTLPIITTDDVPVSFTHEAIGTFKHPDTGVWMVAVIKFNPVTGDVSELNSIEAGPSRDYAVERFKLEAVQRDIVG